MIRLVTIGLLCILNVSSFGQELSFQVTWLEDGQQIHLEAWASNMPPLLSHQGSFGFDGTAFEFSEWVDYQGAAPWVWSTSSGIEDGGAWSAYSGDLTPQTINEELPLFSCLLTISDPEIDSFSAQWGQGGTMLEFIGADFSEIDIEASGIQLTNPSIDFDESTDPDDDNPSPSVSCQLWMDSTYTNDEGNSTLTMWASSDSSLTGLQGSISYDALLLSCDSVSFFSPFEPTGSSFIDQTNGVATWSWYDATLSGVATDSTPVLTWHFSRLNDAQAIWSSVGFSSIPTPLEATDVSLSPMTVEAIDGAIYLCAVDCESVEEPGTEGDSLYAAWEVEWSDMGHRIRLLSATESPTTVMSFQGSLSFDADVVALTELENPSGVLPGVAMGAINAEDGLTTFSWFAQDAEGVQVQQGDVLIELGIEALQDSSSFTIDLTGAPLPIEVISSSLLELGFESEPGSFVTPSQGSATGVFLDFAVIDGSYSTVTIEASMHSESDISGIQGTLNFDPNALEVLSISSDLDGFSESNIFINSSTGTMSFVWFSSIPVEAGSTGLFQVEFAWEGEATEAALTFSDIPLELEFINSEFQVEEIAIDSLNVVRDLSNSSVLSLIGNYISSSQVEFELVANEGMILLSAQGSFGWNVVGALQELTSSVLSGFSTNNFSVSSNAVGWSWFSSNLSPVVIESGEALLSGTIELTDSSDTVALSFGSTLIPIEFADANFQTIDVSELTLNLVNDGDFGSSCPSDFDDNCVVGSSDLLFLLASYSCADSGCEADLNGDGTVNVADLLELLAGYGQADCCN